MSLRITLCVLCIVLSGCAREQAGAGTSALGHVRAQAASASATADTVPMGHASHGFANLPDRGDLLAYPGKVVRQDGAYTWHRTNLSEEHALRAIADGHLRMTTPEGEILDFQYDSHVEHPSGDWTWIGHRPGHEGEQTILTFGDRAAFGSIAQSGKPPLRLTVRDGVSWLVETDPVKVAAIANAATRPQRPDYHIVPESELPRRQGGSRAEADGAVTTVTKSGATAVAATAATSTVDLLIGYTAGFATANNGTSGALTRLNYLIDVANAAYRNGHIGAQVRLVKAMPVNYTDGNSNDTALEQLSGYKSGTGPVTPNAAFNALRAAREQYGADLVTLVRDFKEPEHAGCGIAWLLGGGLQGLNAGQGWDELGYSVISDGHDAGTDGKTYYCLDETLAHEMGHNMGAAHDKATAKGDDGTLDNPDDYGAYTYSFGYKTTATTGDFYTIMAYGDSGQTIYRTFSTPLTKFCGGRACGSSSEDNARTLIKTIPVVASFRAASSTEAEIPSNRYMGDFDGDGKSDVLWRNHGNGAGMIWRSANSNMLQSLASVTNLDWRIAGFGDFNGDGKSDVLWRNDSTGACVIWKSANSATPQSMAGIADLDWMIGGVGDFDGDGKSDVLWHNGSTGASVVWKSANSATPQSMAGIANLDWVVGGIGDFNGDGKSDVLWHNGRTGASVVWKSANSTTPQSMTGIANLDWVVGGVGDFNGDGKADILWHNGRTGASVIWKSANSATPQSMTGIANLDWVVGGVGDFNGDSKADVLWRNGVTGANVIWKSASSTTQQSVSSLTDPNWDIAPQL